MSIKAVLIVCAQALLIQTISAQCIGAIGAYDGFGYGGFGYGYDGFGYGAYGGACGGPFGYGPAGLAASNGPGLAVTSASPMVPIGVSVISENAYEGALAAGGAVPFLGTVAIEGALPTAGAGAIAYGCGNGAVGITAEDLAAYGFAGFGEPFGYGYGLAGPFGYGAGYGAGYAGFAGPFGYGNGFGYGRFGYGAGCGCGAFY